MDVVGMLALVPWRDNRRSPAPGALWLLGVVSLVAVCSGGKGASSDATAGSSADARAAATSCPQRLAPVPAAGQTETVGSGTTASCSEQALRTALANVKSAGGGTVLFNCGGPYTITLSSALPVGSAKDQTAIVDGNSQITISGGGTTRIFDLDNYTNFVVQRLTLRDGFVAADQSQRQPRRAVRRGHRFRRSAAAAAGRQWRVLDDLCPGTGKSGHRSCGRLSCDRSAGPTSWHPLRHRGLRGAAVRAYTSAL